MTRICFSVVVVSLIGAACWAEGVAVQGTLTLPGGSLAPWAWVSLTRGDDVVVVATDAAGKYMFEKVQPGTYILSAGGTTSDRKGGFYQKNDVVVGASSVEIDIVLSLDPEAPPE